MKPAWALVVLVVLAVFASSCPTFGLGIGLGLKHVAKQHSDAAFVDDTTWCRENYQCWTETLAILKKNAEIVEEYTKQTDQMIQKHKDYLERTQEAVLARTKDEAAFFSF